MNKYRVFLYSFFLILSSCRPSVKDLQSKAVLMLQNKDYKSVIDLTGKILESDTLQPVIYNMRGVAFLELYNIEESINSFNKSILLDSSDYRPFYNRGRARFEVGKIHLALKDYNSAIALMSDHPDLYNNRGISYFTAGNYVNALEDFNKALNFEPTDEKIWYNRGNVKLILKDYEGALSDFSRAININAAYSKAYQGLGIASIFIGKKDEGCNYLGKAAILGNDEAIQAQKKYCYDKIIQVP